MRRAAAAPLLAAALVGAPVSLRAQPIVERFVGERYEYDVGFLFWGRAAVGRITLEPEREVGLDGEGGPGEGRYVATLLAETKGFVGWLSPRRHVYTSTVVPCEQGRRFCSVIFVKDLVEGDRREVVTTFVDRERRLMTWVTRRSGRPDEPGEEPIPEGARYDDMLAAFFNFRAGAYGPVEKGRRYEIDMLPVEGAGTLTLRVLDGPEEVAARRDLQIGDEGLLLAVRLPRAIFKNEGQIFVWFSDGLVPYGATVRNYLGLGDVSGRLAAATRPPGQTGISRETIQAVRRVRRREPVALATPDR